MQKVAVLAEMEESIFKKEPKTELSVMKPKIEPKQTAMRILFSLLMEMPGNVTVYEKPI